jgi:hypothetical protein
MLKIREYAKAIAALLGAVATFLVSVNAPAEWSLYLGSIVAVLTGVATFGIPNKPAAPVEVPALPLPADTGIAAAQQTVQNAIQSASELERLKQGVSDAFGVVPVLGPLVQQAINVLPKL